MVDKLDLLRHLCEHPTEGGWQYRTWVPLLFDPQMLSGIEQC